MESASAKSNVALRYVRMFEDGNYPMVADPVYLTNFMRQYAACLGLDELQASREFVAETVNYPARPRLEKRSSPIGSRTGRSRPRLFKFYAGPLSVIAVVWTIGPLSPLNQWNEKMAPGVLVMERRLATTVLPPPAEAPLPTVISPPPPVVIDPPLPTAMGTEVADAFTGDEPLGATSQQESSAIGSGGGSDRSATNKASDELRAEQLARMKLRMSLQDPLANTPGGA